MWYVALCDLMTIVHHIDVLSYMCDYTYDILVIYHMMKVLLLMHVSSYTCNVNVWSKWYVFGLFVILLSMCEVIGRHIYIALVGLDWDDE